MRIHEPRNYQTGEYKLINPSKYFSSTIPRYKSSFELRFMEWCDKNKKVVRWAYEPYFVDYVFTRPKQLPDWVDQLVDGKSHKYYIDFHVELYDNENNLKTYLIELKPKSQMSEPNEPKRKTRAATTRYVGAMKEYAKNVCKWETTKIYCKRKGYEFFVLNEDNLFF